MSAVLSTRSSILLSMLLVIAAACGTSDPGGGTGDTGGVGGEGGELGAGGIGGGGGEDEAPGGAGGAGGSDDEPDPRFSTFEIEFLDFCIGPAGPNCGVIRVGWTRTLTLVAKDAEGEPVEDLEVSWTSSDTQVVTVDETGLVTGVGLGAATVTASADGWDATQAFRVESSAVAKIVLAPETLSLEAGTIGTFEAVAYGHDEEGTILPVPLPGVEIDWMVANPMVAELVEPGMVRAIGPGATWVIAASPDGIPAHEGHALLEVEAEEPLPQGMELEQIALGTTHGCGIAPGGGVHCWGRNEDGQLGVGVRDDPMTAFPSPGPISADPTLHFSTVAASGGACALDHDGKAWCWGNNTSGELGLGSDTPGSPLPLPMVDDRSFTAITLGLGFGCALDAEQQAWCWGSNADGQVGVGVVGRDRLASPDWDEYWTFWEPTQVVGEHSFAQIAAGLWSACALDEEGRAWCWGDNSMGTLGNGDESVKASGEPLEVVGDHRFVALSLESAHACGVTADGEAYCWGRNLSGGLGDETPSPGRGEEVSFEPVRVRGDNHFTTIAAGAFHTCALDQEGVAFCWGNNEYGQAGTGVHAEAIRLPSRVHGDLRFRALFAGSHQSCGITLEGRGYCWGDNLFGRLGLGFAEGVSPVPWPVAVPEADD